MRWTIPAAVGGAVAGFAVAAYPALWRDRCLNWGARPDEVEREMPGDKLLPEAPVISTRAISIESPPSAIWPWLVQMGPHRAGAYTYDWIENLFGLDMHSADEIIPGLQDLAVGDELPLGEKLTMRIELLEPEHAMVMQSDDGAWVWEFGLYPEAVKTTRLVSRNRIQDPRSGAMARAFSMYVMEPGSLVMERKMLLGIKARAERLHAGR
ncbi:MAG: SRPBCC family protein [Streptomycetaceae bacterium]|nr:SRPBCC family protein [Streptomycetaceae bacterium]